MKITKKSIQKTVNKNIFTLIVILGVLSSIYMIIDYQSLQPFAGNGKHIGDASYHMVDFVPGDGIISALELVMFYLINTSLMVMFMLRYLIGDRKT